MRRAGGYWREIRLVSAYQVWRQQAAWVRMSAWKSHRASTRFRRRRLTHAWEKWVAVATNTTQEGQALQRAVHAAIQGRKGQAWERWRREAIVSKDRDRRGVDCRLRIGLRRVGSAMIRWLEEAGRAREGGWRLQGATASMRASALGRAVDAWRCHTTEVQGQEGLVVALWGRWLAVSFSRAWGQWRITAMRGARELNATHRARAWSEGRNLRTSWCQWRVQSVESARQARLLRGAVMRFVQQALSHAVDRWMEQAKEITRQRASMEQACLAQRRTALVCTVSAWRWIAGEVKDHRERLAALKAGTLVYRVDLGDSRHFSAILAPL